MRRCPAARTGAPRRRPPSAGPQRCAEPQPARRLRRRAWSGSRHSRPARLGDRLAPRVMGRVSLTVLVTLDGGAPRSTRREMPPRCSAATMGSASPSLSSETFSSLKTPELAAPKAGAGAPPPPPPKVKPPPLAAGMLKPPPPPPALGTKPPAAGAGVDALLLPPNTPPPKGAGAVLPPPPKGAGAVLPPPPKGAGAVLPPPNEKPDDAAGAPPKDSGAVVDAPNKTAAGAGASPTAAYE